jgi:hypothetical protein
MNTAVFPFSFNAHLTFAIICFVFFILQFIRLRYAYQLIMAVAIPLSLLIYVAPNKAFFYAIGIFEILALIACAVTISAARKQLEAKHSISEAISDINSDIKEDGISTSDKPQTGGWVSLDTEDNSKNTQQKGWLDDLAQELGADSENQDGKVKENIPTRAGWVDMDFKD